MALGGLQVDLGLHGEGVVHDLVEVFSEVIKLVEGVLGHSLDFLVIVGHRPLDELVLLMFAEEGNLDLNSAITDFKVDFWLISHRLQD